MTKSIHISIVCITAYVILMGVRLSSAYGKMTIRENRLEPVKEIHKFGLVSDVRDLRHSFVITNLEDSALEIEKVESSCKSIQILSYPEKIQEKGSGELEIRLVPDRIGNVNCSVLLETSRPGTVMSYEIQATIDPNALLHWKKLPYRNIDPAFFTRRLRRLDQNLMISMDTVLKKPGEKESKLMLIDIRDSSKFAQFHIPGSINIPLYAVKTKLMLKSHTMAGSASCNTKYSLVPHHGSS